MYKPNYKALAQFGGELCEQQTQKMRKNDQNPTFLGYEGEKYDKKVENPTKHI